MYIIGMSLRRYVKPGERETFLIVFIVLAGLAAYLRSAATSRPSPSAPVPLVASDGGMEKLWFEASMGKGDMRPLPDPEIAEEAEAEAAPAPSPQPVPAAPAAEPEPSFPEPLPVAEQREAPERQRIAPMTESLLHGSHSGSGTSAFLAFPKTVKEIAPIPASVPPASAAPPAKAPVKRRVMRPLMGN